MADNSTRPPAPDQDTVNRWQDLMKSLRAGHQSDFVIKCGDEEHPVHKNIMSLQSAFFDRACNGSFKEAEDGVLHLPDDDPLAVRAMIDCIYLGNYDDTIMQSSNDTESLDCADFLPLHAKVYVLGDKYGVEALRTTSTNRIAQALENDPDCVLDVSFRDTIDVVYKYTMPEATDIRRCLVDALASHPSCLDTKEIDNEIQKHPALAYEVGMNLRQKYRVQRPFHVMCSRCGFKSWSNHLADDPKPFGNAACRNGVGHQFRVSR